MATLSVSELKIKSISSTNTEHDTQLLRLHGITKQLQVTILKLDLNKKMCANEANKILLREFGITQEIKIKIWKLNQSEHLTHSHSELSNNAVKSRNSNEKQCKCDLCEQTYNFKSSLNNHLKKNHKVKQETYSCSYPNCQFQGISILRTRNHMAKIHNEKPFVCITCEGCFKKKQTLQRHLKTHSETKQFKCENKTCNFRSYQKWNLNVHLATHLSKDEYQFHCEFELCQKSFCSQSNLNKHVLSNHTPEIMKRKHRCAFCKYETQFNQHLVVHMRVHTREKPFKCEFCEYSSSNTSTLKRHLRIHTGESPYLCSICKRKFTRLSALTDHMRIHTGEKPYSCSICKNEFTKSSTFKCHMRIHTGEKPNSCSQCDFKTASRQSLKSHVAARHK